MAHSPDGTVDPETFYTKQSCIGGGSFGKVYKGVDKRTGQTVAIKIVDVENAEDEVDDIIQEISILSELNSPYVTKYHGSYLKGSDLWIIMEFCSGGSCGDMLRAGRIPEEYICIIVRELLLGLDYLHGDKKLHRDIKGTKCSVRLGLQADRVSSREHIARSEWSGQARGLRCLWPTVGNHDQEKHLCRHAVLDVSRSDQTGGLRPQGGYLVSGHHRTRACERRTSVRRRAPHESALLDPQKPPPQLEGKFSPAFKDFIEQCLKRDPRQRPSARELVKHPFVRKAKKTTYLTELIERYERWVATHGHKKHDDSDDENSQEDSTGGGAADEDLWDFGTVKPAHRGAYNRKVEAKDDKREEPSYETVKLSRDQHTKTPSAPTPPTPNKRTSSQAPYTPISPAKVALPPSPAKQYHSPSQRVESVDFAVKPRLSPPRISHDPKESNQDALAMNMSNMTLEDPARREPLAPLHNYDGNHERQLGSPKQAQQQPAHNLNGFKVPQIPPYGGRQETPRAPGRPVLGHEPGIRPPPATAPTPQPAQTRADPHAQIRPAHQSTSSEASSRSSTQLSDPLSRRTSASSNTSTNSTTAPIETYVASSTNHEITALNHVVLPSLDAALQRRAYNLASLSKQSSLTGRPLDPAVGARRRLAHENVKRLVHKAARIFREIEFWDAKEPVGMGDEVGSFLEAWLEELLVRVEAEDEDEEVERA